MKFHHIFHQTVNRKIDINEKKGKGHHLYWWQLLLIGIGSIIGAGFFLGTGLSIKIGGPLILIGYLVAGLTAFFVFSALAELSVYDPQEGSFRTYARKAFGPRFGFMSGWMYWFSGILIMSSETIALSTFTQYWFPHIPLWIFSIIYALLGFGINLLGVSDFGKIESIFASIKLSTLIIFIIFGLLFILGIIHPMEHKSVPGTDFTRFFATGFQGFWSSLIFIFFSFGGIAVVGIASKELKNREDIPKVGKGLIFTLITVYILSLFFVLRMVSWKYINETESPFVTALSSFHIPYIDSIFNVIIISAAFSTMVGALYSITNILVSLSKDHDAPAALQNTNEKGVPISSLGLSGIALIVSIILSYFLPNAIYEYITTAAGVMLILNWSMILASHLKIHKTFSKRHKFHMYGSPLTNYIALFFIFFAISGGLYHMRQRIGILVSFVIIVLLLIIYQIYKAFNKEEPAKEHLD